MSKIQTRVVGRDVERQSPTKISAFDKLSALLFSSIIVVGSLVLIGLAAWMNQFKWEGRPPMDDITFGRYTDVELHQPTFEFALFAEPDVSLKSDSTELDLPEALAALTTVASNLPAVLDAYGKRATLYNSLGRRGDRLGSAPGGDLDRPLSEAQRWRITYEAATRPAYVLQLDHFGIELGALSKKSARIDLVRKMAGETETSVTTRAREKRLYFSHTSKRLRRWDQRTLQLAGIENVDDKIVVQLYGSGVRQLLGDAEKLFLERASRKLADVCRTFFKIRKTGDGYEFFVHRIEYHLVSNRL